MFCKNVNAHGDLRVYSVDVRQALSNGGNFPFYRLFYGYFTNEANGVSQARAATRSATAVSSLAVAIQADRATIRYGTVCFLSGLKFWYVIGEIMTLLSPRVELGPWLLYLLYLLRRSRELPRRYYFRSVLLLGRSLQLR